MQRVELTMDGGRSWKYCFRQFLNKPLRCVVSCEKIISKMKKKTDAIVKARDETLGMGVLVSAQPSSVERLTSITIRNGCAGRAKSPSESW